MLRNLFSLPCRLTSRPRRRQATRRRALADRLPWIEPLEGRLLLATDVWTGADAPRDNNWSDTLNWLNGVVPGPNDTAEFSGSANSPYGSNVDTAFTVGALVIDSSWGTSGGTINVNAPLTLNGLSDGDSGQWSGGTINLNDSLINKGTFTLGSPTGSGTLSLTGTAALINQGNIIQAGTYNLVLNSGSELDNQGSYTFQGDGNITKARTLQAGTDTLESSPTQGRSRRPAAPALPPSTPPSAASGPSMWRRAR